jgi:hypothetical protein
VFIDAVGAEVHSSGSEGSGEPAAKKPKKGARPSKRGCKMTVQKRMAQFPGDFFQAGGGDVAYCLPKFSGLQRMFFSSVRVGFGKLHREAVKQANQSAFAHQAGPNERFFD